MKGETWRGKNSFTALVTRADFRKAREAERYPEVQPATWDILDEPELSADEGTEFEGEYRRWYESKFGIPQMSKSRMNVAQYEIDDFMADSNDVETVDDIEAEWHLWWILNCA